MHPNVDPEEIEKFSNLAQIWWDTEGKFRPLHQINPLRLNYIQQICPLKGLRVLDIGCGGGILTEAMCKAGATVTGIDLADKALNVARLHAKDSELDINYQLVSAEDFLAENPKPFDIVTCLEVLEHVPDPKALVATASKLVKPNGHGFFASINRTPKAYLFAIVGAEYVLRLLPRGTHHYDKFIKPEELTAWSRSAELTPKDSTGLHYNPITKNYWLAPGMQVNYMIHTQKLLPDHK